MGKVKRFEDLIAWQKAGELTKQICLLTRRGEFMRDFGLGDQIQRASVSTMSNLAEGFERGGRAEFHQFVVIAKGSCASDLSTMLLSSDLSTQSCFLNGSVTKSHESFHSVLSTQHSVLCFSLSPVFLKRAQRAGG